MYNRLLRSGFTILPIAKHKIANYSAILLVGYAFNFYGRILTAKNIGSSQDANYQDRYNYEILAGKKPLERQN